MKKLLLTGAMALFLCASHQVRGNIFDKMRHGFERLGHDIKHGVTEGVHGVVSTLSPAARKMASKIDAETKKVSRFIKDTARKVSHEASHVADQAASEATHVADAVAKGAKITGLVSASVFGSHPKRPSQAETEKAVLKALLGPSATMVKALYCSDTFMVKQSIREWVDSWLNRHPESVDGKFQGLIDGATQNGFENLLKTFFKEAGQGLEVDKLAIRNDVAACEKEWGNNCENIFPQYNAWNLAVMLKILEKNQEILKQKNMTVCQFADQHASK